MVTPFEETPTWFEADFYLETKLAKLVVEDPKGNWTRASMVEAFEAANFANPYDHYLAYGDIEGLSPNPLFSNTEYLAAKTAAMGSTWTSEMVAKAIADAGLTLMEHYLQFGSTEGLSPSSAFNQNKYYEAKLEQVQTDEPGKGWTLETLKAAFADAGLTPLDHYLAYAKTEGLDKHDYSDNGDPIPHPGNKIALTKGADTVTKEATVEGLKTSDRDDMISAIAGNSTKGTLTAGDVIDGGAGVDTLTVDMQTDYTFKSGSIKNVEKIVLNNTGGHTFNAKGVEAADVYTVNGGDKGMLIENVDSANTDYSLTQTDGKFEVKINESALTGKADNVNITLNGVGTAASTGVSGATVAVAVAGTKAASVEGVTLLAAQGTDNFVSLTKGHETVKVMGAGDVSVAVAGGLKSFDASGATGDVVANLGSAGNLLKAINGGAGDDTFAVNGLVTSAVVDGGEGKDTLNLGAIGAVNITNTITGVETLEVTATGASSTSLINLSKIEGLETFKLTGTGSGAGTYQLRGAAAYDTLNLEVSNMLGAAGSVSYDGAGKLNVIHSGTTSGSGADLNALTANNATELNFSNTAATGKFDVSSLSAAKVETIAVDAGDGGFELSATAGTMNALTSITVAGNSAVVLNLDGSATSFDTIDAGGLQGNLTVDLGGMTLGATTEMTITGATAYTNTITLTSGDDKLVYNGGTGDDTINGGSGADIITVNGNGTFKITGGAGADIIALSDGKDTLVYAATGLVSMALEGKDHIMGFETSADVIQFGSATLGGTSGNASFHEFDTAGSMVANNVNHIDLTFATNQFADNASHVVAALGGTNFSIAVSSQSILAIDNGSNTYLWLVVNDSSATGIVSGELNLVGVLDGVTGSNALTAGDITLI